ncbi:hypothetical protein OS493_004861 [Desmophyllum pertusum]|uniref:Tudor domain-containing protein n=1 Tax=Desmophyllum pertusum TaxID=174260 RepID=A0A9W9Z373_9CNID|nr:hypothetical protein OS493_004861 [Desmophyllum pertusum]
MPFSKSFWNVQIQKRNKNFVLEGILCQLSLDKPAEGVPSSGIVKVLIMNVIDASCYWVRDPGTPTYRVKVCQVYREDEYNREPMVLVKYALFNSTIHYVDRGVTECVHVDRLLQLPPQFHSCPFQTSEFVARLIEGKEMEGKVV